MRAIGSTLQCIKSAISTPQIKISYRTLYEISGGIIFYFILPLVVGTLIGKHGFNFPINPLFGLALFSLVVVRALIVNNKWRAVLGLTTIGLLLVAFYLNGWFGIMGGLTVIQGTVRVSIFCQQYPLRSTTSRIIVKIMRVISVVRPREYQKR